MQRLAAYELLAYESPGRQQSPREVRRKVSVTGQPLVTCSYAGMRCAGCEEMFTPRDEARGRGVVRITPGGTGMIHDSQACLDKARRNMARQSANDARMEAEMTTQNTSPTVALRADGTKARPKASKGSEQRNQQLHERVCEARRLRVRACLAGTCKHHNTEIPVMVCRGRPGCQAKLHGKECAQISKGHAELGAFICPDCRMQSFDPDADVALMSEEAREAAENAMLLEMTTGAESTGATYSDLKNLEREFMESRSGQPMR